MLGSVRAVTDITGHVVASFDYEPFGLLIEQSGPASAGAERYTGKPRDAALGLYYFGARYYDPGLGRFITADPARHGCNWYEYAYCNPLVFVDPDGRMPEAADTMTRHYPTLIAGGVAYLLLRPMTQVIATLQDMLWSKCTTHVDTITTTEEPDREYIILVHFTDAASASAIAQSGALRPGSKGFPFLTTPDMIGKPAAQVEYQLGLAPGRGSWVFGVRIEPSKVVYRGCSVPFASGQVYNPGGAPEFVTWYEIPQKDWRFSCPTASFVSTRASFRRD